MAVHAYNYKEYSILVVFVAIVLFILHHFVLVKSDTSDVALVIRDIVWACAWMRPRGAD